MRDEVRSEGNRGARCGNAARRDLCGGRRATGVPTATCDTLHLQPNEEAR